MLETKVIPIYGGERLLMDNVIHLLQNFERRLFIQWIVQLPFPDYGRVVVKRPNFVRRTLKQSECQRPEDFLCDCSACVSWLESSLSPSKTIDLFKKKKKR